MPPCLQPGAHLLARTELPILPFLAPRLFQPWLFAPLVSRSTRSVRTYSDGSTSQGRRDGCPRGVTVEKSRPVVWSESSKSRSARQWWAQITDLNGLQVEQQEEGNSGQRHLNQTEQELQTGEASNPRHGDLRKATLEYDIETRQRRARHARKLQSALPGKDRIKIRAHSLEEARKIRELDIRSTNEQALATTKKRVTDYRTQEVRRRLPGKQVRKLWGRKWVSLGHAVRDRRTRNPFEEPDDTLDDDATAETWHEDELRFVTGQYSSDWNRKYATLQRALKEGEPLFGDAPLDLDASAETWALRILQHPQADRLDPPAFEAEHGDGQSWDHVWRQALLWILKENPSKAIDFLTITHVFPYPSITSVADALHYLSMSGARLTQSGWDELIALSALLMQRPGATPLVLYGSHIRLLLPHCTAEQAIQLRDEIQLNNVNLHHNTLLHLTTSFAEFGLFDESLDCLLEAASAGADIDSTAFKSGCATILRKSVDQADGLRVCLRIVSNLVALGVRLNVQLCNIVMLNAVEAGDLKTAFSVYHSLIEHGLEADAYTHAILLKGCKRMVDGGETLQEAIRRALRGLDVQKASVVATEILHCLCLHHFTHRRATAWSTVVEAYTELFDSTSLIQLGILDESQSMRQKKHLERMQPTPAVLGIMIAAYLRNFSYAGAGGAHAHRMLRLVYQRYRVMVQQGQQPIAQLCETDYTANAFVMHAMMHPDTFPLAADMVRDMEAPLPAIPATVALNPCLPTVQTLSIFMHGFIKERKMESAEQMLQLMHDKGLVPTRVTWNMLIHGYSKFRDPERAIVALRRMEAAGHVADEITARLLSRIPANELYDVAGQAL